MTRVVIHIDKLVLRGLDRAAADAVASDIKTQLQKSFAGADAGQLASRRRINAGQVMFNPRGGGGAMARGIAARVADSARFGDKQ